MNKSEFFHMSLNQVKEKYPFMGSYFEQNGELFQEKDKSILQLLEQLGEEEKEHQAIDPELILSSYYEYFQQMSNFLGLQEEDKVRSLTILSGVNKKGEKEKFEAFQVRIGEIVAIVGPTGSGKSRLLADIEWTANRDTPTGRRILINEEAPNREWRFSSGNQLVAQLSQNMNFVMDLSVREFLELHAASRLVEHSEEVIKKIIEEANHLAGESFLMDAAITSLSGGQSRALMIADTAILSESPIVLIDEIENAGIDRKKALSLLVKEEKIVLIATHDPILALMADKRIIIRNGGIDKILDTSEEEKELLEQLQKIDRYMMEQRFHLRNGEKLKNVAMATESLWN